MQKETIATHYGYDTKAGPGAMAVPIYQTTAYDFGSAEAAAARFALEDPGQPNDGRAREPYSRARGGLSLYRDGQRSGGDFLLDRKFSRSRRQHHRGKENLRWHDGSFYAHA